MGYMSSGIRATIAFTGPGNCPITQFSAATGTAIDRISTSVATPGPTGSATEFVVEADHSPETGIEPIFSYGSTDLYRVTHDEDARCPCACLGEFECPIQQFVASGETVTLVFHAAGFTQLQDIVAEFRERYEGIDVQQLLQPPITDEPAANVFVNRGKLTARQLEVLRTAYEMGYFERPKRANATDIGDELGISQSTATEHLVAAQRKILDDVLMDDSG